MKASSRSNPLALARTYALHACCMPSIQRFVPAASPVLISCSNPHRQSQRLLPMQMCKQLPQQPPGTYPGTPMPQACPADSLPRQPPITRLHATAACRRASISRSSTPAFASQGYLPGMLCSCFLQQPVLQTGTVAPCMCTCSHVPRNLFSSAPNTHCSCSHPLHPHQTNCPSARPPSSPPAAAWLAPARSTSRTAWATAGPSWGAAAGARARGSPRARATAPSAAASRC